jgi:hypothetical protein
VCFVADMTDRILVTRLSARQGQRPKSQTRTSTDSFTHN